MSMDVNKKASEALSASKAKLYSFERNWNSFATEAPQKILSLIKSGIKPSVSRGPSVPGQISVQLNFESNMDAAKEYVETVKEKLEKYYKSRNSFLSYQHGVFVTANSRKRLRDMLNVIGHDVIYCDTDSIKYLHDHKADFDRKNEELQKQAIAAGAYADNIHGDRFYLGTWDCETPAGHEYTEFKTLGAKKYVFKKDEKY